MLSAGEIALYATIIIVVVIVIWYFAVAFGYSRTLDNFSYTRGANLDTGESGKGSVNMNCENGDEICVWQATGICSGAINAENNFEGGPEPFSDGLKPGMSYGQFDINNTIDLTKDMSDLANGKQAYTYDCDLTLKKFGGKVCPNNYNSKTGAGQRPQLISTYTCIPKGSKCVSSINTIPLTPIIPVNPNPPPPGPPGFSKIGTLKNVTNLTLNNNNQICAVSSDNKTDTSVYCINDYTSGNDWSTHYGSLNFLSLSPNSSAIGGTNNTDTAYINPDIFSKNWTQLPLKNRFISMIDASSWCLVRSDGSISCTSPINSKISSPLNLVSVVANETGNVVAMDNEGNIYYNINWKNAPGSTLPLTKLSTTFKAKSISLNSSMLYVTTTNGKAFFTRNLNSVSWLEDTTISGLTNIVINDKPNRCGIDKNGNVWCTTS